MTRGVSTQVINSNSNLDMMGGMGAHDTISMRVQRSEWPSRSDKRVCSSPKELI